MTKKTSLGTKDVRQARLIEALQLSSDEASCQACLGQLDDYIAAQLAGEDYLARFADLSIHLDACLDCAGAYARLYELALAEATDRLPQPEQIPSPDLGFLQAEAAVAPTSTTSYTPPEGPRLVERLQQALRYTGNKLTLQLSADLLTLLRPSPAAPPTRAPADVERYGQVLVSLKQVQIPNLDLPLTFTVYNDAQQPGACLVEVIVEPPGQRWPNLGGNTVALFIGDEKRGATTDVWGVTAFENIPIADLARLTIEVSV